MLNLQEFLKLRLYLNIVLKQGHRAHLHNSHSGVEIKTITENCTVIQVIHIFHFLTCQTTEFKTKQSKKKNLTFSKHSAIVQQHFSSILPLTAPSLCCVCMAEELGYATAAAIHSTGPSLYLQSTLSIRICWFPHFLPHFSLLPLTRSPFLCQHSAWVIKRTVGHL